MRRGLHRLSHTARTRGECAIGEWGVNTRGVSMLSSHRSEEKLRRRLVLQRWLLTTGGSASLLLCNTNLRILRIATSMVSLSMFAKQTLNQPGSEQWKDEPGETLSLTSLIITRHSFISSSTVGSLSSLRSPNSPLHTPLSLPLIPQSTPQRIPNSSSPPTMATDLEKKAKEAFVDDDFELAVDLYSQAIDMDPKNADLFADRAQANIKLANFTEAVADANRAIQLDASMAKAYLRKGTACLKLEEFQTAKAALELGASLAPGDTRFSKLITECVQRIAEETGELPSLPVCDSTSTTAPEISKVEESVQNNTLPNQSTVAAPAPPKPKYRHEYYQKPEEVVVTIFAKGVPANHVVVDFGEQILSVTIEIPGEDVYHFQPRLFGKIKPADCKYHVLSTKIEIRLAKAEPINWASLEFTKEHLVVSKAKASTAVVDVGRPTYPSSKSKSKNWDEIEAQVKKEEKEEKLDGDAALNKFFREIYQGADEDVKRAMSKSFVESNGTVLSTNWKEVGAKKVDGTPPDGMEMKKWEY